MRTPQPRVEKAATTKRTAGKSPIELKSAVTGKSIEELRRLAAAKAGVEPAFREAVEVRQRVRRVLSGPR